MIHLFKADCEGDFCVWSDCEKRSERDGRCIGVGRTEKAAIRDAIRELERDRYQLYRLLLKKGGAK